MQASDILSSDIFPLKKEDTVSTAKIFFESRDVFQLPVVENGQLLGMIQYADIVEEDENLPVKNFIKPYHIHLPETTDHVFEILRLLALSDFSALPVMNAEENTFAGIVTAKNIVHLLGTSALSQAGAIINLEMNARDYSLAELARIAEYNDQKIIGVSLFPASKDSAKIIVSVKLNTTEIKSVLVALERYGYVVSSAHQFNDAENDMSPRMDWLLKYLNT